MHLGKQHGSTLNMSMKKVSHFEIHSVRMHPRLPVHLLSEPVTVYLKLTLHHEWRYQAKRVQDCGGLLRKQPLSKNLRHSMLNRFLCQVWTLAILTALRRKLELDPN